MWRLWAGGLETWGAPVLVPEGAPGGRIQLGQPFSLWAGDAGPTVPAHGPPDNPNSIVRGCSYRLDLCVGCGRKRRVVGRAGQAPDPRISRLPTAESCPALARRT